MSTSQRPIPARTRPDLDVRAQLYEGRRYWVIKDPLTLRYFRFQEEEHAILSWLDGEISLAELREKFERTFAPQKITTAELQQFLGTLYRAALVISTSAGQTAPLLERCEERAKQRSQERWSNLLAIRFRGFNPDSLLTILNEYFGWLFSVPATFFACLLGFSALVLLGVEYETVQARLPGFHEFFAWKNWFWLSLALAVVKLLHEFGHGLACKRLGGECNEMGVMLLVFSPCLYANVSDAWLLPNKWHRAAIGAAGMYVELILASLAVFVWWSTKPGLVHFLALDVIFVCSVSTLIFNANPLMRFDGYYILSDLLEIPNLRSKASRVLQGQLGAWLLGLKPQPDPFLPQRHRVAFALFAVAAGIYGWFVTASILWTLLKMFEPYGFKIVGMLLALVSVYAVLVLPLWRLGKWLLARERNEPVDKLRGLISGSVLLALVISLAWLPLPRYVTCNVVIEQRDAAAVYVDVPGELREVLAAPYTAVEAGQPIVRLSNVDLELAYLKLSGERAQLAARLEALRERALVDDEAAQLVAHTEEALAGLDQQLAKKHTERQRLVIVAPISGLLTPAAPRAAQDVEGRLAVWHGHPLELRNVGARLETGSAIGLIGDQQALTAVLAIDETEIDFVQPDQRVDVLLDELPGERIMTKIDCISADELAFAPPSLSARHGGALQTKTDADGRERPINTTYQASAELSNERGHIIAGARGSARISAGRETLGRRLWREACRTLAWEL